MKISKRFTSATLLSEGRRKAKSPSCRTMMGKVLLISSVFLYTDEVELWADYGTVVQTKT